MVTPRQHITSHENKFMDRSYDQLKKLSQSISLALKLLLFVRGRNLPTKEYNINTFT